MWNDQGRMGAPSAEAEQRQGEWQMSDNEFNRSGAKPSKQGVYEVDDSSLSPCFQNWNGKFWGYSSNTPSEAAAKSGMKSYFQTSAWREVASDPSQSKEGK